jgi:hypothetical protein
MTHNEGVSRFRLMALVVRLECGNSNMDKCTCKDHVPTSNQSGKQFNSAHLH